MGIFGKLFKQKKSVKGLIRSLKHNKDIIRESAADELGKIGDARAIEPLILSLRDGNERVRCSAVRTLGKIGDARAIEPLIQALKDDYYEVRGNAAYALGKIGDTRAIEPLIIAMNDGAISKVGYPSLSALEVIGDERAVKAITRYIDNCNPYDVETKERAWKVLKKINARIAISEMGEIDSADIVNSFIVQIANPDVYIGKDEALEALAGVDTQYAMEAVVEALTHELALVRERAILAVESIILDRCLASLKSTKKKDRQTLLANQASVNVEDDRVIVALGKTFESQEINTATRKLSVNALGHLWRLVNNPLIVRGLIAALKDQAWSVQFLAASELVKIYMKGELKSADAQLILKEKNALNSVLPPERMKYLLNGKRSPFD